jgi:integrase
MWTREFKTKEGNTAYRYLERYTDPLSNKYKTVSVVRNKHNKRSQKDAQIELNRIIDQRLKHNSTKQLKNLTFHDACEEWLEHYKRHSGSKPTTIKEKTSNVNTVKAAIDKNILISKITHKYLQDIINEWAELHSTGHVQSLVIVIRSVYKYALKYYDLHDISVLDKIDIPKKAKTHEELQVRRNNYLENYEITELMECFDYLIKNKRHVSTKRNYQMAKDIAVFQINNGLRIGEVLALKEENIDIQNRTLEVNGTINWIKDEKTGAFGVKETTKTSSSYRTIGLTTDSIKLLKRIMLENKKDSRWNNNYVDRGYIFTNNAGSPLDLVRVNNINKEVNEISSIKKKISSHIYRHTHISILAQLGINLKAIQERVGHSDHKMVLEVYTHVTDKMTKDMMNKLESINFS